MIQVTARVGAVVFSVRVIPRASRNAIDGDFHGMLKVRLTAPPADNRANESLRRFLASCLNVSPSAVRIVSGETSRNKRVEVQGVAPSRIQALA